MPRRKKEQGRPMKRGYPPRIDATPTTDTTIPAWTLVESAASASLREYPDADLESAAMCHAAGRMA